MIAARASIIFFLRPALCPALALVTTLTACAGAAPEAATEPTSLQPSKGRAPGDAIARGLKPGANPGSNPGTKAAEEAARGDDRFAVAAENVTAVEVAREVLEDGGSAADAAIAAILVGCAAHPGSCGLGGGGGAMVWTKGTATPAYVDFRETAPRGIKATDYLSKNPPSKRRGVTVGVPGLAAGLAKLHELGGRLPWKTVVARAADTVERGIPISAYAAQSFAWSASWIGSDARAGWLWPSDAEGRVGEKLTNAPLVKVLRTLAEHGGRAFYSGEIAKDVVATARAANGRATLGDLGDYEAVVREPLHVEWEGYDLFLAPPTSGGGLVVAELFHMFGRDDLKKLELASGSYVHALAEGIRGAYADRGAAVGDPRFFKTELSLTLDPALLRARRARIDMGSTTMPKLPSIADSGTFHAVVVDPEGNVVSVTASLSSMFGSKLVTEGGFALNDSLTEFAIDEYGQRVTSRGPNFPRGGARPVSNFIPGIVLRNEAPVLAIGGSGGLRAITGVASVLMSNLAFGVPLTDAIAAPRFHVSTGGAIKLDPALAGLTKDLVARGEVVDPSPPSFAAVTAIRVRKEQGSRVLEPVFDPRKGGAVTVGSAESTTRVTKPGDRP